MMKALWSAKQLGLGMISTLESRMIAKSGNGGILEILVEHFGVGGHLGLAPCSLCWSSTTEALRHVISFCLAFETRLCISSLLSQLARIDSSLKRKF